MPDLRLPAAIEAFNGVLKAGLAWRCKDRGNAKQQARSDDLTDRIRVLMWTLKDQCVVELRVRGNTKFLPSLGEQLDDIGCIDRQTWPAGDETSMDGDAGENGKLSSASQNQAFDGIKRVELSACGCNLRKVPTDGRRWSADAPSFIQNTPALKNATDGASRRNRNNPLLEHYRADRICSGISEITSSQLTAQAQNLVFSGRARSIDGPWRACRSIGPVDAIKSRGGSPFDPAPNGFEAYAKRPRYLAQRIATANGLHHRSTPLLDGVLCSWLSHFSTEHINPPQASQGTGLWKLTGYGKPAQNRRPFHSLWKTPPTPPPAFPTSPTAPATTEKRAFKAHQKQAQLTDR
jgi:hypothetical protein